MQGTYFTIDNIIETLNTMNVASLEDMFVNIFTKNIPKVIQSIKNMYL